MPIAFLTPHASYALQLAGFQCADRRLGLVSERQPRWHTKLAPGLVAHWNAGQQCSNGTDRC